MLTYRTPIIIAVLAASLILAGCSSTASKPGQPDPAPVMYKKAKSAVQSAYWSRAIPRLQNLAATYPFGAYAVQADLDLVYAYHMAGDADSAVDEAQRFVREHPRSQYVPYALYMIGVARFPKDLTMFQHLFSVDTAGFAVSDVRKSFKAFHKLTQRFPDSQYSADARQRMIYLRNRLAANDVHVARYYVRREAWVAAIRRAQHAIEHYSQTPSTPAAIKIMITGYHKLGLKDLEQKAKALLAQNQGRYKAS